MKIKLGIAPIAWSNDDMPELGGDTPKMKAVLVSGTSIDFKIDKELIADSTPGYEKFYFKNGILKAIKL